MSIKVLIVEDQFIEANNLQIMLEKAGYTVCGIARSVTEAIPLIEKEKPALALVDIQLKGPSCGTELASILNDQHIAFIYVSANSNHETLLKAKATQPYGFIVKPFRERDLLITLEIAQYRHENSLEAAVRKEQQLREQLNGVINSRLQVQDKMLYIARALQAFLPFDYLAFCTDTGSMAGKLMSYLRIGFDEYQRIGLEEFQVITNLKMSEIYKILPKEDFKQEQGCYSGTRFAEISNSQGMIRLIGETFKLKSLCMLPIKLPDGTHFNFAFYSRRADAYDQSNSILLERLKNPLINALEKILSADMTTAASTQNKIVSAISLQSHTSATAGFNNIVGNSHLLLGVFDAVMQVAPADTSVLILGESGTGKESIAESIHNHSRRNGKAFVKINCAALPSNLIESELFGHEKGAFTGAVERRLGKFERADKGTLFLDEIGDMPYDLQAKLLRVLQENEIERIGGSAPIKIDVRVIAATNKNLEKEVAAGRFRLDLYYRLNVFPINLPALRERKDDLPLLINYFIDYYGSNIGKKIGPASPEVIRSAMAYEWPGNIRELQNLVQRAVLIAKGDIIKDLDIPKAENTGTPTVNSTITFKTIEETERDHILNALRQCRGKVWGSGGAAELLNLPPSTLSSKIKKLGIKRDFL